MTTSRTATRRDAEIGFRIRQLRQNRRITQVEMAAALGLTYQQLQKYELGRNRLSVERLLQIAEFLGVAISEILDGVRGDELLLRRRTLDRQAAALWHRIQSDRHKRALLSLLQIMQPEQSARGKTSPARGR